MREILFRGKALYDGDWVYGSYVHTKYEHIIIPENAERCGGAEFNFGYLVDPETVGQYTGLTDKNGNLIFEGDIVSLIESKRHVVKFEEGAFRMEGTAIPFKYAYKFEVNGNIHDNPELMEVAKDAD